MLIINTTYHHIMNTKSSTTHDITIKPYPISLPYIPPYIPYIPPSSLTSLLLPSHQSLILLHFGVDSCCFS